MKKENSESTETVAFAVRFITRKIASFSRLTLLDYKKPTARAFGNFLCVDCAAKRTGLLLDVAAFDDEKACARGLKKKITLLINIHVLWEKSAPGGHVVVSEAYKNRAANEMARSGAFSVCIGVRKERNARRALQKTALRLTRKVFVLLDVNALNCGRKEDGWRMRNQGV